LLSAGLGDSMTLKQPSRLIRNCITVRGQWMYPRDAPRRLIQLARAGLLSLHDPEITAFSLAGANAAIDHAAANGGPFKMTVITP
jgi:alcohol dehydrogenase